MPSERELRQDAAVSVSIYRIKYDVKESEKLIVDLHLDLDQHQSLTTSRGSPTALAYHVWWTSVKAFVSYHAHRQTDSNDHTTPPWQSY